MEVDIAQDATELRDFFFTILDSDISLEDKLTRMSAALDRGGADVCGTLGDDPALGGVYPLLLAVSVGSVELVEFLVSRGADVNQTLEEPHFAQAVCPSALHQACLDGRLDIVQVLVEPEVQSTSGVRLEPTNARGQTPYHLAVESGNSDLVGYLVERGSWVNACDANGNNALHMTTCLAVDRFALDMVDTLVTLGVSIYHHNRLGFTPVKLATLLGREVLARTMLAHVSPSRRLQEVGFHPLEAAVVSRRRRTIASILDRSSEVPSTDESLNIVVLNSGLNAILRQLLCCPQMLALIDVNGSLGYTPLYNACAARNIEAVRLLLEAGADPDRPSQRQHVLPLKKTLLQNDITTSRLLLEFGASACHCPACSPLLRTQPCTGSQAALVGNRDGELDLLYLALFTDITLCQLLIAGGTCVSSKSLKSLASTEHRGLYSYLYEAGHHKALQQLLVAVDGAGQTELVDTLRSPPTLAHLCRTEFRRTVKPRVFWAVQRISLPKSIKNYLLLDC